MLSSPFSEKRPMRPADATGFIPFRRLPQHANHDRPAHRNRPQFRVIPEETTKIEQRTTTNWVE